MQGQQTDAASWYRHRWPWIIIMPLSSAVIACVVTLLLALKNPDYLVIDDGQYQQLKSDLMVQSHDRKTDEAD